MRIQKARSVKTASLARYWEVDRNPKGSLMFLDIYYQTDQEESEALTITIAINQQAQDVAFIFFIVPETVDKVRGLAIGFAKREKDKDGNFTVKVAHGATRSSPSKAARTAIARLVL